MPKRDLHRILFPKQRKALLCFGEDLSVFSQDELDSVAWALNTGPRKSLGFKCPAELFLPDTFNADDYYRRLVALHT